MFFVFIGRVFSSAAKTRNATNKQNLLNGFSDALWDFRNVVAHGSTSPNRLAFGIVSIDGETLDFHD